VERILKKGRWMASDLVWVEKGGSGPAVDLARGNSTGEETREERSGRGVDRRGASLR
jgi:hypothetical protein